MDHTQGVPNSSRGTGFRGKCSTSTHPPPPRILGQDTMTTAGTSVSTMKQDKAQGRITLLSWVHWPWTPSFTLRSTLVNTKTFQCCNFRHEQPIISLTEYSTNKPNFLLILAYLRANFVHPRQTEMTSWSSWPLTMYYGLKMQISSRLVISIA